MDAYAVRETIKKAVNGCFEVTGELLNGGLLLDRHVKNILLSIQLN